MTSDASKELLREYTRELVNEEIRTTAAGVVVYRLVDNDILFLCLKQKDGFDMTKGRMEPGETPMQTAVRETAEESSITDLDFVSGSFRVKTLVMFAARTDEEGQVKKNPVSGKYEHEDVAWLPFDSAIGCVHKYLRPALRWANDAARRKHGIS